MSVLLIWSLTGLAQKIKASEVPESVKQSFQKRYPSGKVEHWEKEGSIYEAEFDNGKEETTVSFDASGQLIETEVEISTAELPQSIKDWLNTKTGGKKIKEAERVKDNTGKLTYEVEVGDTEYVFDEKFNCIETRAEKGEGKEGKD